MSIRERTGLGLALLVVVWAAWALGGGRREESVRSECAATQGERCDWSSEVEASPLTAARARPAISPRESLRPTAASAPVMHEPSAADPDPHPFTPERARLQHELQLVGALNDALDLGDAPHLRALLERYRAHDPSDEQGLQAGYALIADCLDTPGEATRARAQAYYEHERASTLRRYVRRRCLNAQ